LKSFPWFRTFKWSNSWTITYSRKLAGCEITSALNETVPLLEQEAHFLLICWTRIRRGLARMREAQCATWDLKSAIACALCRRDFILNAP
jgi:hypothetical protein